MKVLLCSLVILLAAVLVFYSNCFQTAKFLITLPKEFEKCHYEDVACLTKNFQQGVTHFAKTGAPLIKLPAIAPLHFKTIEMKKNHSNPVPIDFVFRNGAILGLEGIEILNITGFDKDITQNITVHLTLPYMELNGDYEIEGHIYDKPISGKGWGQIVLRDCYTWGLVIPRPVLRDGKPYMDVTDVIILKYPKEVTFHFTGLYGGDEEKSKEMLAYLNENSVPIYMEIDPDLERGKGYLFQYLFNSVFSLQPYADFFLPD